MSMKDLIKKLVQEHCLTEKEYVLLLNYLNEENGKFLRREADKQRKAIYGNKVYIRGLIEISNICQNDCYYCGIRKGNAKISRYRFLEDDIIECCDKGYELGFRTFVLQGGEDRYFTDEKLCGIVSHIHLKYPDCAITLSMGERNRESYRRLYEAGASRYLLRHETATKEHYEFLHPSEMSFKHRIQCLRDLKDIGYHVGCGFMVGSPGQTNEMLARDLKFIEELQPHMCGIGPFIPHKDTPFGREKAGTVEFTCYLLSIIRLICPDILLPATTALGTMDEDGRKKGIQAGANVIMPNLSPVKNKGKYELYNHKLYEAAGDVDKLKKQIENIGYEIVVDRGDCKRLL